ncbi:MAG: hypothetical protein MUF55_11005 [Hydrogenophaga sp.]|jgi:hypothetical protein|nr:hypothetical protein [Hydrogenophaga sp.]
MMKLRRTATIAAAALGTLALVACGDQPQELQGQAIKSDQAPHVGVGQSQYVQGGWKPGDRTSWEQQLKARAVYGQNDYARMSN